MMYWKKRPGSASLRRPLSQQQTESNSNQQIKLEKDMLASCLAARPSNDLLCASAHCTGTFPISSLHSSRLLPQPTDGSGGSSDTADRDIPAPRGEFFPAAENSSFCPGVAVVCMCGWGVGQGGVMSIQTAGAVRAPFFSSQRPATRPPQSKKKREGGGG